MLRFSPRPRKLIVPVLIVCAFFLGTFYQSGFVLNREGTLLTTEFNHVPSFEYGKRIVQTQVKTTKAMLNLIGKDIDEVDRQAETFDHQQMDTGEIIDKHNNNNHVGNSEGFDTKKYTVLDSETEEKVRTTFRKRLRHVENICKNSNYSSIKAIQWWKPFAFDRLQVCGIAKCGSTFLSRTLKPTLQVLNTEVFLNAQKRRFVIVRNPYSRLVSAFFSKMVGHPSWWKMNGLKMIKPFRLNASEESVRCGHNVTFPEYVKYVIKMHNDDTMKKDPHFVRLIQACNVCVDTPEFIVKLESIKDEMTYVLKTVSVGGRTDRKFNEVNHLANLFMSLKDNFQNCGPMCPILNRYWWGQQGSGLISLDLDLPVHGEECNNVTGPQLAELAWDAHVHSAGMDKHRQKMQVMTQLYGQVPIADREELYRLYRIDCDLFGYEPRPDFVFPDTPT